MSGNSIHDGGLFRVWIAAYRRWTPRRWNDMPRSAEAIEPADERCLNAVEARDVIEGFNRGMLARSRRRSDERAFDRRWAVAVPVVVRIEGDARRGRAIKPQAPVRLFAARKKRRLAS
jgi:hypothetical protein